MTTIGIFDSGVGGLSILRDVRLALPNANIVYFGDTANVPYGGRPDEEIKRLSEAALQVLLTRKPDLAVVACNTATSIAVNQLRLDHPKLPIIGVVPVIKTAAERTTTKKVAVLATVATLSSRSYANLKDQFGRDLEMLEIALPEWVRFVEDGNLEGQDVRTSVWTVAQQIAQFGADVIALGCTHFPFLRPVIEEALPGRLVLDSGPAVARHVVSVLTKNNLLPTAGQPGEIRYLCSGDAGRFTEVSRRLLNESLTAVKVRA